MEKNMYGLQPQSLTNNELERLTYIMGQDKIPTEWVAEMLRRTETNWKEQRTNDPNQLELDLS
jgi:hypothetical protein